jgi:hypothetical protein
MMRRHFLVCMFAVIVTAPSLSAQTFSRSRNVPPIGLSYGDLVNIISRARQLIKTSNASYSPPRYDEPSETLTVGDGENQFSVSGDISAASLASSPPVAYDITYIYFNKGAPVSSVQIELVEYERNITVSGSSQTAVDAVLDLISSDLGKHACSLCGSTVRTAGGIIIMFLLSIAIFALAISLISTEKPRLMILGVLTLLISEVLLQLLLFLPPWNKWLPDVAVYAGNSSWLQRNSALLTLVGTAITIFSVLATLIRWLIKHIFIEPASPALGASRGKSPRK